MKEIFKIYSRWIIKNDEWKFLLVEKNNTRKIAPWKAVFPGWTLEYWEDIEDCLIREVKEETDLEITKLHLISTQKIMLDWVHWLWLYYICETKNLDFKYGARETY